MTTTDVILGRSRPRDVLVCEVFGPTIQGEGPSAGQLASFLRLGDCNLACDSCDTPYSWDWKRYSRAEQTSPLPAEHVAAELLGHPTKLVIITGGEPMMQQTQLLPAAGRLTGAGRRIEIETNGTIAPDPAFDQHVSLYVVSPKLAHMGMPASRRIRPAVLKAFQATGRAVFKFVLDTPADVEEVAALQDEHGLEQVWVMPQATTAAAVIAGLRALTRPAVERGWNISGRLHTLIWEDERGR
ncbi:7-carboxy-7-deazaguanine synthase QueE [Kitasatospora sp. NPDC005856]|uniref:7-carboxy-7-deazaguanine synthase QueE n=1 Tax=Kitasatospora sp. NPDC005856 TaxID=3154566 RepID=UPI0033C4A6F2